MAVDPNPRDLCSLDRVKRLLKLPVGEAHADDDTLRELITDVSERCYRDTGVEFVAENAAWTNPSTKTFGAITVAAQARIFPIPNAGGGYLQIGAMYELTSARYRAAQSTSWTSVDATTFGYWYLDPPQAITPRTKAARRIYLGGAAYNPGTLIEVTGKWGWPSIPGNVQGAIAKQVALESERHLETFTETFNLSEERLDRPRGWGSAIWDVLEGYVDKSPLLA